MMFGATQSLLLFQVMHCLISLQPAVAQLLLTPLIDKGNIEKARKLSHVCKNIEDQDIFPMSYAGFITVDKQLGNHLFFWFFPSEINPKAPLVIWLNGGPGVSSMFGLFHENGPVELSNLTSGDLQYAKRNYSWVGPFSMLYIDQPVGTGYSYSDQKQRGLRTNQEGYTKDLYSFITQFYRLFPEYLDRELYIGGQSYAGHYVPALAYQIHTEIQAGRSQLPLTGIYLGGPSFDYKTQNEAYPEYLNAIGAITLKEMETFKKYWAGKYKLDAENQNVTEDTFVNEERLSQSENNNWVSTSDLSTLDQQVQSVMATQEVRDAVHSGDINYTAYNNFIANKLQPDLLNSTKDQLAQLMNNYKVLIYSGNLDVLISPIMIEKAVMIIPWSLRDEYKNTKRSKWKGWNNNIWGFYSQTGSFCHVVVNKAGHHVPHDQPQAALNMMLQFVSDGCIVSGKNI